MRVRITFSKTGPLKYIGHLDLQSLWERAVRRAGLPLAYTNAFHPQPKIYFASALPLGFSSRCEVVDLRLNQDMDINDLSGLLQAVMPSGIGILDAGSVDEAAPPLQTLVIAAEYEAALLDTFSVPDPKDLNSASMELGATEAWLLQQVHELLSRTSLPRERRGKAYDLRPLIEKLEVVSDEKIFMRLTAREAATGRPEEVVDALGIKMEDVRIERTGLIFQGIPVKYF
jgi:radical SAM-linked protein